MVMKLAEQKNIERRTDLKETISNSIKSQSLPTACLYLASPHHNLSRRYRVWSDPHESPTNRVSESNCLSKRTDVEVKERGVGGNQSLTVELLRLLVEKEDISNTTISGLESRLC